MDERNAEALSVAGVSKFNWLTVKKDISLIRAQCSGENLDQRALARTVFADECMHAAGMNGEAHVTKRVHARIGFRKAN